MAKLLLSFDFEDWHQLVHRGLGHAGWDSRGHALERQTAAIFELLDELGAKATFFVLGITAERYPDLVRAIAAKGHDLACHGYEHRRVPTQSRDEFKADVERCAELVEQLAGKRPVGYRAPAFSITRETPWAYEILAELGFRYDSSQYDSPRIPQRIRGVPRTPYRLRARRGTRDLGVPGRGLARRRTPGADGRRRVLARAAHLRAAQSAPGGRRRERLPCAVLPSVRARPAAAAGVAAREPDSEAARARGLEERPAQPGQAAGRGSDSCDRPRVHADQL